MADAEDHRARLEGIMGKYGLPAESLLIVEDVAAAARAAGYDPDDTKPDRLAKSVLFLSPPIIYLRRFVSDSEWDAFFTTTYQLFPELLDNDRFRVPTYADSFAMLLMHEIGHHACDHFNRPLELILREREAEAWAIRHLFGIELQ